MASNAPSFWPDRGTAGYIGGGPLDILTTPVRRRSTDRPMIEVRALGTFAVVERSDGSDRHVPLAPRQAALLAYLTLARPRGPVTRDRLLGIFWPEMEEARARAALSQSLYRLRVELGRDVVESEGDVQVSLRRDVVGCDAVSLESSLDRGSTEEALDAYGGDLLDGFHLSGAPEFGRWLDAERARLRTRVSESAAALAARLEADGNLAGAAHWLRRALEWSPWEESLVRELMRTLSGLGDRSGAIHVYELFAKRIAADLEIEPSPELQQHIERLRRTPPARHATLEPGVATGASAAASSPGGAQSVDETSPGPVAAGNWDVVSTPVSHEARSEPRARRVAGIGGIGVLLAAVFFGSRVLDGGSRRARPSSPEGVVILPFEVSGATRFDYLEEGIVDLLSTSLSLPGHVQPVDPVAVLSSIAGENRARISLDRGRDMARHFGVGRFVLGTIIDDGTNARLSATLYDASGSALATSTVGVAEDSTLFTGVDRLAAGLLAGYETGPDALSFREASRTTASLPALKEYLLGERRFRRGRFAESAAAFERATGIDTSFALAYYRHGDALGWAGGSSRADISRAWELRDRLPPRIRLLAEADHERDPATRERMLRQATQTYPFDVETRYDLAEFYFHRPGTGLLPEDVRVLFDRVIELQPDHVLAYIHLARLAALERDRGALDSITRTTLSLDSIGETGIELRALRALVLDDPPSLDQTLDEMRALDDARLEFLVYRLAGYAGEPDRLRPLAALLSEATRPPPTRALGEVTLALVDAASGRLRMAREALQSGGAADARAMLAARGLLSAQPLLPFDSNELSDLVQPLAEWRRERVRPPPNGYDNLGLLAYQSNAPWVFEAVVRTRLGDTTYTRILADSFDVRRKGGYPESSSLIRAVAAWGRGQPDAALELLDRPTSGAGGEPYGIGTFLRATVLAELGRDREALRWFGSLIQEDQLTFVNRAPVHLAMARILDRLGELDQARYHYARFSELWAHCDPELRPLVDQALDRVNEISQ